MMSVNGSPGVSTGSALSTSAGLLIGFTARVFPADGGPVRVRIVTSTAWSFLMIGVGPIGAFLLFAGMVGAQGPADPTFNKNFEGGALGKIERLGEGQYRCFVPGQQDERGRNRQA